MAPLLFHDMAANDGRQNSLCVYRAVPEMSHFQAHSDAGKKLVCLPDIIALPPLPPPLNQTE